MKVLGIDPGTARTGYALVESRSPGDTRALDYGVITTPKEKTIPERLLMIHQELQQIILLHRPDSCAVEKLFFQKNVRTAMSVGEARGVVLMTLASSKLTIDEYSPSDVKLSVAGYGAADKHQVQLMMKTLLNLDRIPTPDDAADALAVAYHHLSQMHYHSLVGINT